MKTVGNKLTYESVLKALNYDKSSGKLESVNYWGSSGQPYGRNVTTETRFNSDRVNKNTIILVQGEKDEPYYSLSRPVPTGVSDSVRNTAPGTIPDNASCYVQDAATELVPEVVSVCGDDAAAESSFTPLTALENIYRGIIRELQTNGGKIYI